MYYQSYQGNFAADFFSLIEKPYSRPCIWKSINWNINPVPRI